MRKGELLGLRNRDVNLQDGTILVARSYDHDTTKGGHADLIPVAGPLRPFLEAAIRDSPSALVFPRLDGSMQPEDVKLDRVLRRALGRAGVVTGYDHRCRRKGCGYSKEAQGNDPGRCTRCNMRLWAKALPRHVRFHDLRHYPASRITPRRRRQSGVACLGERGTRDNQRLSRKVRSASPGLKRFGTCPEEAMRARAFSLSRRSACR